MPHLLSYAPQLLANRACSVLQVYVEGIHADIVSIIINSERLDDKREVTLSMLHFLFVSDSIMRPSLVSLLLDIGQDQLEMFITSAAY